MRQGGGEQVMDSHQVVEERLRDVIGQPGKDEQSGLLKVGHLGPRGRAEEERQQLGPGVLGQQRGGELGDGVADLLGDGLGRV